MSRLGAARPAPAMTVLAVALALAVTGCHRNGPGRLTAGTITGRLLRVGGPAPGSPVPLPGQVTAAATDGEPAATVSVGRSGHFVIRNLPVGIYSITGTSPLIDSGHATCNAAHQVHVRTARVSRADVICSIP